MYVHVFFIRTIEQRASILGQQVRLSRKLMDEFQKCFLLIVAVSFVIKQTNVYTLINKVTISVEIKNSWGSGRNLLVLI